MCQRTNDWFREAAKRFKESGQPTPQFVKVGPVVLTPMLMDIRKILAEN